MKTQLLMKHACLTLLLLTDKLARRGSRIGDGRRYALGHALRPRLCRAGFTLIELLVVVAVLAILMSLMYPSLRRAIKEAQEVVCINNLHQLCMAATNYNEDYTVYPPPAVFLDDHPTYKLSRVHPECSKASDFADIGLYIGEDPRRFSDIIPLKQEEYPSIGLCPFGLWERYPPGNPYAWKRLNLKRQKVDYMYRTGYGYFGRLEYVMPGYHSYTRVPAEFKTKYAERNCDPDAALWGDSVCYINAWGEDSEGYTHTISGRVTGTPFNEGGGRIGVRGVWQPKDQRDFLDFDRQNMGRVDGSVRARWPSEVNPNRALVGAGLNWEGVTNYVWWY